MNIQTPKTVGGFSLTPAMQASINIANTMAAVREAATPIPFAANDEELTQEQALAIQSSVANKLLAEDGLKILSEMYLAQSQMVEAAMIFVLPVMQETDRLKEAMGEKYEEFEKGFTALREDLAIVASLANVTLAKHKDLQAPIDDAKLAIITDCSLAYSKLQTQLEDNISPELMRQMNQLEEVGIGADILTDALAKLLAPSEEAQDV